jgi:hypothetical protein
MNTGEYVEQTARYLEGADNEVIRVDLKSGPVTAAFRSVFRARWLTKFDLVTVLADCQEATDLGISTLTSESLEYAIRQRSRFLGTRNATAVTVFPVLVAGRVQPEAKTFALARPPKLDGAFVFPTIVDLAAGEIYSFSGKLIWGSLYAGWQRDQLAASLQPPVGVGH